MKFYWAFLFFFYQKETKHNNDNNTTNKFILKPWVAIFYPQNTMLSLMWQIFSEFLMFYNLFHKLLGQRNNIKIWDTGETTCHAELV